MYYGSRKARQSWASYAKRTKQNWNAHPEKEEGVPRKFQRVLEKNAPLPFCVIKKRHSGRLFNSPL